MIKESLEDKLYRYSKNWPQVKLELWPEDVVEIFENKNAKIRELELKIYNLSKEKLKG